MELFFEFEPICGLSYEVLNLVRSLMIELAFIKSLKNDLQNDDIMITLDTIFKVYVNYGHAEL